MTDLPPLAFILQFTLSPRLTEAGGKGTHTEVAELLGESTGPWSRYLHGHVDPSAARILRWAERSGCDITATPTGWLVHPR